MNRVRSCSQALSPSLTFLPTSARRRVAFDQRGRASLASIPRPPSRARPFLVRGRRTESPLDRVAMDAPLLARKHEDTNLAVVARPHEPLADLGWVHSGSTSVRAPPTDRRRNRRSVGRVYLMDRCHPPKVEECRAVNPENENRPARKQPADPSSVVLRDTARGGFCSG